MWGAGKSKRRSTSPLSSRSAAASFIAAALALAGCRSDEGSFYRCSCSFLTDFDDPVKLDVRACSPSREMADPIARGCAQSGAPAPVQACACAPDAERAGARCRADSCEVSAP